MLERDYSTLNVLVTGVGGPTGQGVLQSLHAIDKKPVIFATDISSTATGFIWSDKSFVIPEVSQPNRYSKCVDRICKENHIDIIFPGSNAEANFLSRRGQRLESPTLATCSKNVWEVTGDKLSLHNFCLGLNLPTPLSYLLSLPNTEKLVHQKGFPIIVKPRSSSGSRGIKLVSNTEEAQSVIKNIANPEEFIVQEYLSGESDEFTVGSFFDMWSNERQGPVTIAYKRSLYYGNTIHTETVSSDEFYNTISEIGNLLRIRGYCNFQFIKKGDVPYLTDVNARFSSSTSMALKLGYNWVRTYLENLVYDIKPGEFTYPYGVVIARYLADVVIPQKTLQNIETIYEGK